MILQGQKRLARFRIISLNQLRKKNWWRLLRHCKLVNQNNTLLLNKKMMADTTTYSTDKKALAITVSLRYGGGIENVNSCAFNKQLAFTQGCKSNPPQRKSATHYFQ
jgi:hypothetical protein